LEPDRSASFFLDALGPLLDTAPCGFLSFGDDGIVSLVNATLAERLGYARDEVVGRHVERLFPVATRIFYQTHLFPLVKLHGRASEIFLLLRAKNGDDVGMLCNAERRQDEPVAQTRCVLLEVHERRKYEDALLDAKRRAERANELLEEQAIELETQHQILQDQATELETQSEALQILNDDLVARTVELERAQAEADAANLAKSEFLATMSHELRTPLNAIGGYADLLRSDVYGPIEPSQRQALERITRAQRHLLGLINDILNFARAEAGRVEYVIADVLVAEVVTELAAMIEPQVAAKELHYRVESPNHPIVVRADHEKLVQILLNLLSNAVKFTAAGGRVTVAWSAEPGATMARIEVRDTGRGIPSDRIEAVFEPFVQVRGSESTLNEGTGLGLAISRNLARGMQGDLTATSVEGAGSVFLVTLPMANR
jgi:PAS domain S-box-containing protein